MKVDEEKFSDYEDYYDDNWEVSESADEPCQQLARNTILVDDRIIDHPELEINKFFNEFPIRILNSHERPFFYAEDIAAVLKIKKIRNSIINFDETEIVSQELRRKYQIVTYMRYKNGYRRKDNMILLTEFGAYRMILNSRSQKGSEFRAFVYDVLYQLRTVGSYEIRARLEELNVINERQQELLGTLQSELGILKDNQARYQNWSDKLTLIEMPNDPFEIEPSNLPQSVIKKSAIPIKKKHNTIDDPTAKARMVSTELGIPHGMIESDYNTNIIDLRKIRAENIIIARQFLIDHAPKHTYIVTSKPTPELLTAGTATYSVYVKEEKFALNRLKMLLGDNRPARVSSSAAVYTCPREKIINSMNAVKS